MNSDQPQHEPGLTAFEAELKAKLDSMSNDELMSALKHAGFEFETPAPVPEDGGTLMESILTLAARWTKGEIYDDDFAAGVKVAVSATLLENAGLRANLHNCQSLLGAKDEFGNNNSQDWADQFNRMMQENSGLKEKLEEVMFDKKPRKEGSCE